MQIRLRVRYRSSCRAPVKINLEPTPGTAHGSFSHSHEPRSEAVLASHLEVGRGTTLGVGSLDHSQDISKNLLEAATCEASLRPLEATEERVEKAIQLDQIALEEVQVLPESRIIVHSDPRSVGADRFRYLRMCLRELWNTGKLKSLQITSPLQGDGKSTIALNLATALAEGGKRKVLLIEADLHHPTLTEQLGLQRRPGLGSCLEGSLDPASAIRRIEPLGWYLLPAGEPHSNATELLQTETLAHVLQRLTAHFDWILIDSPPVLPLTDALSIARQANASLLVAREGRTPREAIERAIGILGRQRVLGLVLNAVNGLEKTYSGYYGYGGHGANDALEQVGVAALLKESGARSNIQAKHPLLDPPEK